ncbi:[FeFe] hydrogenase H-cluster radical SAM maturase HydG [Halorhodospira abdelmalekii]|uniref:[FeFe] hydrogenase H-cluster radical SAM maturase HydG n=1 Tax=Halorhodospira abdelmalekii TaxID=421629 RepID=UPI0019043845|nr:[FeFe] hydrogenase H-cluster radical SAM maturase HydG [Halorhodospira abdelmalekii]MBK1735431.1 [FeFe] hydrogenase H-cluster radical SAM maturase HydG [Halorhodospira abdelmalekii]
MKRPGDLSERDVFDIDEGPIWAALQQPNALLGETRRAGGSTGPLAPDPVAVREILAKARDLNGLDGADLVPLMVIEEPELLAELFDAARFVKEAIYGRRLVLFAPLYISNQCANECSYCAFRARNKAIERRTLSQEEIAAETRVLIEQGHKRLLLVTGEVHTPRSFDYILEAIDTIYAVEHSRGQIRRINVNIAPLTTAEFARLQAAQIGTYQLFQETYHHDTYRRVHHSGLKADYQWRLTAIDRAMAAGIDDCGIGVLFGLADWRFELLALMQHIRHLEARFGVGPHTISVPRLEPASGSAVAAAPPQPVSDDDFRKIVAILRLAVPYTGIVMSTRETAAMRRDTFALGVSQISAGSRTQPGGYAAAGEDAGEAATATGSGAAPAAGAVGRQAEGEAGRQLELEDEAAAGQFALGDHRSLAEVVRDVARLGYLPSFCTACYRRGRTGADFMDLAKPGEIKLYCDPNAAATFEEYLLDCGDDETRAVGEQALEECLAAMEERPLHYARVMVDKVKRGKRDVCR